MDLIQKELNGINFVVKLYADESVTVFEPQKKIIEGAISSIIDSLAVRYNLVSNNSVRTIKHYSFSSRVKDAGSLKEKLVRNGKFSKIVENLPPGYNEGDGFLIRDISNQIRQFDDLIGVKILTDLNDDCKKMFDLIKSSEFTNQATGKGITLDPQDLKEQPQKMRNGLEIYKIKGTYNEYRFELQIKSKIISAWGDMEHSILYKDYFISPVRDTTQSSMNHVGKLLFDIDDFLYSIRQANKNYKEKSDALEFLEWIDANYSRRIFEKLDQTSYRFDNISEMLFAVFKYRRGILNIETKDARGLYFTNDELRLNNELESYCLIRNKSFDLIILESIVLGWMLGADIEINANNVNRIVTDYLDILKSSAAYSLSSKLTGYELEELVQALDGYYNLGFQTGCDEKFVLNIRSLYRYFKMKGHLADIAEDTTESDLMRQYLDDLIFVGYFDGDLARALALKEGKLEVDREGLKKYMVSVRDKLSNMNDVQKQIIDVLSKCLNYL